MVAGITDSAEWLCRPIYVDAFRMVIKLSPKSANKE